MEAGIQKYNATEQKHIIVNLEDMNLEDLMETETRQDITGSCNHTWGGEIMSSQRGSWAPEINPDYFTFLKISSGYVKAGVYQPVIVYWQSHSRK